MTTNKSKNTCDNTTQISQAHPKLQSILLRERLKEIEIRLVDLADFLGISRPTAYKFIQMYETGYKDNIESKLLKFFDFVMNEKDLDKSKAMSYIVENLVQPKAKSTQDRAQIIANLLKKENSVKIEFIDMVAQTQVLDPILEYLLECQKILAKSKKALNEEEVAKITPLNDLYNKLGLRLDIKIKEQK